MGFLQNLLMVVSFPVALAGGAWIGWKSMEYLDEKYSIDVAIVVVGGSACIAIAALMTYS